MRKPILRVEIVVSGELECIPVPRVGSRLCDDANDCGRTTAILGREVAGKHTELLRGVSIRERVRGRQVIVHVVDAVQLVVNASHSTGVDRSPDLVGHPAAVASNGNGTRPGCAIRTSGNYIRQLAGITSIEWKFLDGGAIDNLAKGRRLG